MSNDLRKCQAYLWSIRSGIQKDIEKVASDFISAEGFRTYMDHPKFKQLRQLIGFQVSPETKSIEVTLVLALLQSKIYQVDDDSIEDLNSFIAKLGYTSINDMVVKHIDQIPSPFSGEALEQVKQYILTTDKLLTVFENSHQPIVELAALMVIDQNPELFDNRLPEAYSYLTEAGLTVNDFMEYKRDLIRVLNVVPFKVFEPKLFVNEFNKTLTEFLDRLCSQETLSPVKYATSEFTPVLTIGEVARIFASVDKDLARTVLYSQKLHSFYLHTVKGIPKQFLVELYIEEEFDEDDYDDEDVIGYSFSFDELHIVGSSEDVSAELNTQICNWVNNHIAEVDKNED